MAGFDEIGRLTTDGPPGRHLVRIEATAPDGQSKLWFRRKIWVDDGAFQISMPLAWNEAPGVWTVTATDVLTGTTAAKRVAVLTNETSEKRMR